ncbi:hypothetical protein ABIB25_000645 [Nakamurella sp. UYEF19]|uniref:DUF6228 family protein n=1 Tax=Nakamurella sp. UYEF19 TaxID=1756392 RepID=UPI00339113D8
MVEVNIGSGGQGLHLEIETPDHLLATLRSDGLTASCWVFYGYTNGLQELVRFFEQLAQDWSGWPGTRVWESLEEELRIEAKHELGHVQLLVTLTKTRTGWRPEGWKVTVHLTIDPGQELAQIAPDLAQLTDG